MFNMLARSSTRRVEAVPQTTSGTLHTGWMYSNRCPRGYSSQGSARCNVRIAPRTSGNLKDEKSLARLHVWWPDLDIELEKMVKTCEHCQETKPDSPRVPLEPWKWPSRPWSRVHVDYAGPFLNSMFFIVVDAHSKWVEIFKTRGSDAATTINCLRSTFAHFGLPSVVVSDNGPCFTSRDFKKFLQWNGVTHVTSAPYHPQSNGLAEKMV